MDDLQPVIFGRLYESILYVKDVLVSPSGSQGIF